MFKATRANAALFQWQDRRGRSIPAQKQWNAVETTPDTVFLWLVSARVCVCARVDSLAALQSRASVENVDVEKGSPSLNWQPLNVWLLSSIVGYLKTAACIQSDSVRHPRCGREKVFGSRLKVNTADVADIRAHFLMCHHSPLQNLHLPDPVLVLSEKSPYCCETHRRPPRLMRGGGELTTVRSLCLPKASLRAK